MVANRLEAIFYIKYLFASRKFKTYSTIQVKYSPNVAHTKPTRDMTSLRKNRNVVCVENSMMRQMTSASAMGNRQ